MIRILSGVLLVVGLLVGCQTGRVHPVVPPSVTEVVPAPTPVAEPEARKDDCLKKTDDLILAIRESCLYYNAFQIALPNGELETFACMKKAKDRGTEVLSPQ